MGWTKEQWLRYETSRAPKKPFNPEGAAPLEIPLHNRIIKHCREQWPAWKYIHANPVVKSTIGKGCQDFTLFLPSGRILCVECKARDEKPDKDQLIWHKEMEMLGHTVHVVRSFDEFLKLL